MTETSRADTVTDPAGHPNVDLLAAFSQLQALTLNAPRVEQFLSQLADLTPQLGHAPVSCSVTLVGQHQAYTVAASDQLANQVDEVQYDNGDGPCLQAIRTGEVVHVSDLAADSRWPGYREHAVGFGVRASRSLPLAVAGTVIGGLNIYSTRVEAFDHGLSDTLDVFAAQAAAALAMVLRQARQDQVTSQLEQAIASRTVIDQALGILMAQQRCTADEAFGLLRAHSQNTNRKMRDVAAELVERVSGSPAAPGAPFSR